ncbi:MAG: DUF4097 family beta strand repeat protein [Gemmatimonadaceae bacterium]|nr:DUF4097 family beta strand repeat protein [Gemmatimonadaceae bacterium]
MKRIQLDMTMNWKRAGLIALLSALPAVAAAQDYAVRLPQIDTTVALEKEGTVDLTIISGRIRVLGWDRQDVKISARIDRGYVKMDAGMSRVRLSVEGDRGRAGEAIFEVSVPRGSRVVMNSTSGDLFASGTRGEVNAESVSGDIDVSDVRRRLSAESVSGSQHIANVVGDVRSEAVSGRIEMENIAGDIEAETVSGRVVMLDIKSKFVKAGSVSGRVAFAGPIDPAGRYEFESHSGSIRLAVPENTGALLRVETFSGHVESDFPVTLQPNRSTQNRFEFQIGNGRARITAESFSGSINIIRGTSRDISGE